jgi:hypothetical protein
VALIVRMSHLFAARSKLAPPIAHLRGTEDFGTKMMNQLFVDFLSFVVLFSDHLDIAVPF